MGDLKTLLNQFCQRVCRRPVTKEDIFYTTIQHGLAQFSATVKLNCVGGGEFRGGVCSTRRTAEKSAALQALQAHKTLASLLCWTNRAKAGQLDHYEPPAANPTMTG